MTHSTHDSSYRIASPIDLLRIIQDIHLEDDAHLFYLGFSNPNDVDNCGEQAALDVTRNPLIALFFACIDKSNNDGEIIVYHIQQNTISHSIDDCSPNTNLVLTDRGTFIFINGQQHNAHLLAKDCIHHQPVEIIIEQSAKCSILQELEKLGISLTTLYPEMTP